MEANFSLRTSPASPLIRAPDRTLARDDEDKERSSVAMAAAVWLPIRIESPDQLMLLSRLHSSGQGQSPAPLLVLDLLPVNYWRTKKMYYFKLIVFKLLSCFFLIHRIQSLFLRHYLWHVWNLDDPFFRALLSWARQRPVCPALDSRLLTSQPAMKAWTASTSSSVSGTG